MNLGNAIYSLLTSVTTKVYPGIAPQDVDPSFIVYNIISNSPEDEKDGVSKLDIYRVQFDCIAFSFDDVQTLATSVRAALDRKTGTYSSVKIQSIRYSNENDITEFDNNIRRKSMDFIFRVIR